MIGILLISLSTFLSEVGDSISKDQIAKRKQSLYTAGFLSLFAGFLVFIGLALVRGQFIFRLVSLPTFSLRVGLEILQAYLTIYAISTADRSTYSFLRTLTIPLLLIVDMILGYQLSSGQILGMAISMFTLFWLFINHGLAGRGARLVLLTAVNAVATISLYKYNVTHFNSVEGEQVILFPIIMGFFWVMAKRVSKENPWRFFREPLPMFQSLVDGVASGFESFAYLYAPASVILTAKRSLGVLWAIISGNLYFRETHAFYKIVGFVALTIGLLLLTR